MEQGNRPIFPRPYGIEGTGIHWGSWGCPQRKVTAADDTVAHFQNAAGYTAATGYTATAGYTAATGYSNSRIHGWTTGYAANQQDTWLDYRIHSQSTGYVAGLQDTQPINRIRGWTTGYTANQQDTWLDYRIHSQTGYVDTPRQQHLTAAGTRKRYIPMGTIAKRLSRPIQQLHLEQT